jgi:hypothetical protein
LRELALHILDVAQNSVEAGAATITITVVEDRAADTLGVTIQDDGPGMSAEAAARVFDAGYTSRKTRRWGLGLPLCRATCERCNGEMGLTSAPGAGTTVSCRLRLSHVDRPPLGDMGAVLQSLLCAAGSRHVRYRHQVGGAGFELDSAALQAELDDVALTHPAVLDWVRRYVNQSLREIGSRA